MSAAFDGRDFLSVAQALAEQADEASLRTAISRAYYAAFLVARDRILPSARTQGEVWRTLRTSSDTEHHRMAEEAGRLQGKRELADYGYPIDAAKETLLALTRARSLIARIDAMR